MTRHHELPPAARRRKTGRRPWASEHHRLAPIDDLEAHILSTAYAADRNTRAEEQD